MKKMGLVAMNGIDPQNECISTRGLKIFVNAIDYTIGMGLLMKIYYVKIHLRKSVLCRRFFLQNKLWAPLTRCNL